MNMPELSTVQKKRNIKALGFVSMFNDIASEMIYPIIPIFLTTVLGAPPSFIGLIEGVAESTASLLKVMSGWLSDKLKKRKVFVTSGYLLSAVSKGILAIAVSWTYVLFARFTDRFGKGIRTSARDALIADSSDNETRGASFGLHRAMDQFGAVIGPLTGLALIYLMNDDFPLIFLAAVIPGLIAVGILIFFVREPVHHFLPGAMPLRLNWREMNRSFKVFLLINILFALANSSDAFLILRAQSLGFSTDRIILLYVVFNLFYSLLSYPFGKLSDRIGQRPVLIFSFLLFAAVYTGFAMTGHGFIMWVLFPLYGIYMAMSDGIGKAYIIKHVPSNARGTALGLFYTSTGVMAFLASLMAGLLWQYVSIASTFLIGACLALLSGLLFAFIKSE